MLHPSSSCEIDPCFPAHTSATTPFEAEASEWVFAPDTIEHLPNGTAHALILEHLGLVEVVARNLRRRFPQEVELDDLISAGMVGLVDAARRFNPLKQVQFKSYAQFRIRGAILDSLRSLDWSPRELRRQGRAVGEVMRQLSSDLGRTPGDHEVADALGLGLAEYQSLLGELGSLHISSLNAERGDDAEGEELDFLAATSDQDPLLQCMQAQEQAQLEYALERISERERFVITCYYLEGMTLKEIGLALGVVESRVSQIRSKAVSELRRVFQRSVHPPHASPVNCQMH